MRRWLAKSADFGANQGRGYQHSQGHRYRTCAADQYSHQPTGIPSANPGSGLADNNSKFADTSATYADTDRKSVV